MKNTTKHILALLLLLFTTLTMVAAGPVFGGVNIVAMGEVNGTSRGMGANAKVGAALSDQDILNWGLFVSTDSLLMAESESKTKFYLKDGVSMGASITLSMDKVNLAVSAGPAIFMYHDQEINSYGFLGATDLYILFDEDWGLNVGAECYANYLHSKGNIIERKWVYYPAGYVGIGFWM